MLYVRVSVCHKRDTAYTTLIQAMAHPCVCGGALQRKERFNGTENTPL